MLDKFMYNFFGAIDTFANGMDKLFLKFINLFKTKKRRKR